MNSLAAMPIEADSLREFYAPILDTVIDCFCQDALVPTDKDTFATAAMVMQGPAAIREVITDQELAFLSAREGALWAKGVTPGSRPDQFLKSLKIDQWGWEELETALTSKFGGYRAYFVDDEDKAWLESRGDQWLQKFYILLAEGIRREECDETALSSCGIIRVTESRKINHVLGPSAYFPKGRGYQDLPQVKKSILAGKTQQLTKKIEEALVALGVSQIGTEERLDLILSTYYCEDGADLALDRHLEHMRIFIKAWKKEGDANKFCSEAIFKVVGDEGMCAAEDCYLDLPLSNTGLSAIYRERRKGVSPKQKLWTRYMELKDEGFSEFAVACGVEDQLTIDHQSCVDHPRGSTLQQDSYGSKFTGTGINDDYTIFGLKALLRLRDRKVNLLIWNAVRNADPEVLEATFRPNQKYTTREAKSSLVIILSSSEWIPDKKGTLRKPSVMAKAQLYSAFKYDNRNGWLDAIGFGEVDKQASEAFQRKKELAKEIGLGIDVIETLCGLPKEKQAEYIELIKNKERADAKARKKQEKAIPFHDAVKEAFVQGGGAQAEHDSSGGRASRNPGRRKQKLEEEISADLAGASSAEGRFTLGFCKKWKAKNDQVKARLTSWYGGRCQICDRTFTQRNNQPYFEGLYLVPYTKEKWIDRAGNVLCLCPWHSAKFQFGSKEIDGDILDRILGFVPEAKGGSQKAEIALRLCGEVVAIKFHEDHFLEIQTMVEESRKAAASKK